MSNPKIDQFGNSVEYYYDLADPDIVMVWTREIVARRLGMIGELIHFQINRAFTNETITDSLEKIIKSCQAAQEALDVSKKKIEKKNEHQ